MKKIIIPAFFLLTSFASVGQADSIYQKLSNDYRFKPESKNWQEQIFAGIHVAKGFEKYKGHIQAIGNSAFKYDEITLNVDVQKPEYRILFEKGIFYPSIIGGNYSGGSWEKNKPDTLKIFGLFDPSVLSIGIYEEIKMPEENPKIKRLRFWIFRAWFANPTEYIMDIENPAATDKTDLKTFIEGCKLTFIKGGGIII